MRELCAGITSLKALCLQIYRTDDVAELQQKAYELEWPLESLRPEHINILAIVAYARRHLAVLEKLLTYPAPPKTTFEDIERIVVENRVDPSACLQHCSRDGDVAAEWRAWVALLGSGWIHDPASQPVAKTPTIMTRLFSSISRYPEMRSSPLVPQLAEVMCKHDLSPHYGNIASFLSITPGDNAKFFQEVQPCTLDQAKMILSFFPVSRFLRDAEAKVHGSSADIILPITQWGRDNDDRLTVMRMLLEQGLDPNDTIHDWGLGIPARLRDTALHMAAELGDTPMAKLLMDHGASNDKLGRLNDTPAQRAQANGHSEIADMLESSGVPSESG